ncbi:C4-dicarboxylate ABC transporter [Pseudonocardia benzenivorans]
MGCGRSRRRCPQDAPGVAGAGRRAAGVHLVAAATVLATAVQELFGGPSWAVDLLGGGIRGLAGAAATRCARCPRATAAELRDQVHGAWLLVSVATAGLATVVADLSVRLHAAVLLAAAAALWLLAILLYLLLVALVGWRLTSTPFVPAEVTPDSWVLMGALAISALTGDHVQQALAALRITTGAEVAHGLTVVGQVAALAWIVPLLVAQVWTAGKLPGFLTYDRTWWAAVFPLGMLSAASSATARSWPLAALTTVALVLFWDAFAIWVAVATGLLHRGARLLRRSA